MQRIDPSPSPSPSPNQVFYVVPRIDQVAAEVLQQLETLTLALTLALTLSLTLALTQP